MTDRDGPRRTRAQGDGLRHPRRRESSHEHRLGELAVAALGGLPPDGPAAARLHVANCPICQLFEAEAATSLGLLATVPPEAFLDGPPPHARSLLRATLRRVDDQDHARARRAATVGPWSSRVAGFAAATVILVAAVAGGLAGGTALGRHMAGDDVAASPPGTVTASSRDATTGAAMTVTTEPAAGWVRLKVRASGIGPGQRCRVVVVARDGSREQAGSWVVSAAAASSGTTVQGTADIPVIDVRSVQIQNADGAVLVDVPVPGG